MAVDFIGAGWNFPLQVDATNAIALATQVRDIEQAIEIIIRTAPGERPMRPEFGCRIQDHLFSPTNEATAASIAASTVGNVRKIESRCVMRKTDATRSRGLTRKNLRPCASKRLRPPTSTPTAVESRC